jgi:hypothetical protein
VEKLKTFYDEHKRAVIVTSTAVGVFGLVTALRVVNGTRIDTVDLINRKNGDSQIIIWKRNGKAVRFHNYNPKEVPAA